MGGDSHDVRALPVEAVLVGTQSHLLKLGREAGFDGVVVVADEHSVFVVCVIKCGLVNFMIEVQSRKVLMEGIRWDG